MQHYIKNKFQLDCHFHILFLIEEMEKINLFILQEFICHITDDVEQDKS